MTVYMITQMTIHDRESYGKYEAGFMEVFEQFNGKMLSVDDDPQCVAGEWTASRSILMEFPDRAAWKAWITSPAYAEISKHRITASVANAILVKGLDGATTLPE